MLKMAGLKMAGLKMAGLEIARSPGTRNHNATAFAGQRNARRGSLLLEVVVGAALLATLLVIINQVVVRLHRQTALIDKQAIAQQTLENLLEEFCSHPWNDIDSTAIDDLKIPARASSKLPHAQVAGDVVETSEPMVAKRITLRIGWQDATDSAPQGLAAVSQTAASQVAVSQAAVSQAAVSQAAVSQAAGLLTSTPLAPTSLASTPVARAPQEAHPRAMGTRTLTTWVYQRVEGDQ